jgi:hypothetical protein
MRGFDSLLRLQKNINIYEQGFLAKPDPALRDNIGTRLKKRRQWKKIQRGTGNEEKPEKTRHHSKQTPRCIFYYVFFFFS